MATLRHLRDDTFSASFISVYVIGAFATFTYHLFTPDQQCLDANGYLSCLKSIPNLFEALIFGLFWPLEVIEAIVNITPKLLQHVNLIWRT